MHVSRAIHITDVGGAVMSGWPKQATGSCSGRRHYGATIGANDTIADDTPQRED